MSHVPATLLVAVLLLPALPTEAAGPIVPTLHGPTLLPAARDWTFTGQLVVGASGTVAPLPDQEVGLHLNGVRVSSDATDALGKYIAKVRFPVGIHTLDARVFEGSLVEGTSAPLTIHSYPTWPAPPGYRPPSEGWSWDEANISWYYPWTDGGYPVLSFTWERSDGTGPYVHVYTGPDLNFTDTGITPGTSYAYRGTATTAYATSNLSWIGYHAEPLVATIGIVGYNICDAAGCATIPDGGSFTTTAIANVTVEMLTAGVVDHHPVSPPGVADRPVHGEVAVPGISRLFLRYTNATGDWNASSSGLWAHAPAAGCETFGSYASARTDKQGRHEATGSFTLCV